MARRKLPAGFVAVPTGTMADLYSVRVVSSSEVYLGGDSATLLRYDGSAPGLCLCQRCVLACATYRMVVDIAGELSSPRGLWVLVSGGEVIELHEGKQPVIHSLYFEGNNLEFTAPRAGGRR